MAYLNIINSGNRGEKSEISSVLFNRLIINKTVYYFELNRACLPSNVTGIVCLDVFFTQQYISLLMIWESSYITSHDMGIVIYHTRGSNYLSVLFLEAQNMLLIMQVW